MRENIDGKLYTLNYAAASSVAVDPIEKKPLFNFYPGSTVLSLGSVGCNFRCKHCQNWNISQAELDEVSLREILPEDAVKLAEEYKCKSIAWTYNEPTMWLEYTIDSAKLAKDNGLKSIYVTNGYMTKESLDMIGPYLDAANVDLKGISEQFYKELCDARMQPVLDNIKRIYDKKIHLEITNLMIPGYNDSEKNIESLVKFMVEEVGVDVPLHFTRFFPYYELKNVPPTAVADLEKAYRIAKEAGMKYVYIGNVPSSTGENTYCHNCGEVLVERDGYQIMADNIKTNKKCPKCGTKADIIV
jgi:pyruvate formate lyase activating enzyme